MVFGGAKISAPAMAAAHGMKEVTLHQATNKQVRPLMAQAAGASPAADPAAIPAGSMELAGHMLPTSPDLVPFPEVPRARPAKFTGLPRAPAPRVPQMPTGLTAPQVPAGLPESPPGGRPESRDPLRRHACRSSRSGGRSVGGAPHGIGGGRPTPTGGRPAPRSPRRGDDTARRVALQRPQAVCLTGISPCP